MRMKISMDANVLGHQNDFDKFVMVSSGQENGSGECTVRIFHELLKHSDVARELLSQVAGSRFEGAGVLARGLGPRFGSESCVTDFSRDRPNDTARGEMLLRTLESTIEQQYPDYFGTLYKLMKGDVQAEEKEQSA